MSKEYVLKLEDENLVILKTVKGIAGIREAVIVRKDMPDMKVVAIGPQKGVKKGFNVKKGSYILTESGTGTIQDFARIDQVFS